jgi:hypothetical protein
MEDLMNPSNLHFNDMINEHHHVLTYASFKFGVHVFQ